MAKLKKIREAQNKKNGDNIGVSAQNSAQTPTGDGTKPLKYKEIGRDEKVTGEVIVKRQKDHVSGFVHGKVIK